MHLQPNTLLQGGKYKIAPIVTFVLGSFILIGCTNSAPATTPNIPVIVDRTDSEQNTFSAPVAIVKHDIDYYQRYSRNEGIKKSSYTLSADTFPIFGEEGDFWSIGVGQDGGYIKKSDCMVEIWSAEAGHGYILPNLGTGSPKIPVHLNPYDNAKVIDSIAFETSIGEPCLGRENGWFKIEINKKTGYVKESEGEWCIHVFNCSWIR